MGLGVSLFLIAVGAILLWAVDYTAQGVDINAVGAILLVVGFIGLLLSLLFWSSFAPFYDDGTHIDDTHGTGHGTGHDRV